MKFLLATDGSDCAENAARVLAGFSLSPEDTVMILHVVTSVPFADDYRAQVLHAVKRVAPKITAAAEAVLTGTDAELSSMERHGAPDEEIIRAAEETGADLVVMGARGLRGMKAVLLGSITRSVAINGTTPLLVTKPRTPGAGPLSRILFATDGSAAAAATGRLLSALPFSREAEVVVVHVPWLSHAEIPERFAAEIDERAKTAFAEERAAAVAGAEEVVGQARRELGDRFSKVHGRVLSGDPTTALLEEAELWNADLIALGSRGLRGFRGMMGSVSRRILDLAKCPVLIGRPPAA